ncbi:hypothetical protein ACQCSX_00040 [Pseudarthrobacter sp. P1]|uniref:hypothetical protein n=1 Tax=Pseudarthrobacter sp. P1 TaxID=3418418 RepID=UPI003CF32707
MADPAPGAATPDSTAATPQDTVPAAWPVDAPATGDSGVDRVLSGARILATTPVARHTATYATLHDALVAELDADPTAQLAGS